MNYSISKILPYVRRYVLLGIYDVLDGEGVPYQKEEDTVVAKAEVYGNLSVFSISAEAQEASGGLHQLPVHLAGHTCGSADPAVGGCRRNLRT